MQSGISLDVESAVDSCCLVVYFLHLKFHQCGLSGDKLFHGCKYLHRSTTKINQYKYNRKAAKSQKYKKISEDDSEDGRR